jgi:hypothetical protein
MRRHSLSIDGRDGEQDLAAAMATHRLYRLAEAAARRTLAEVAAAVRGWEELAASCGIDRSERAVVSGSFATLEDTEESPRT